MERGRLAHLLFRYYLNELSEPELGELQQWLDESPKHRLLLEKVIDRERIKKQKEIEDYFDEDTAWQKLASRLPFKKDKSGFYIRLLCYAAVVLTCITLSGVYWMNLHDFALEETTNLVEQPNLWAAKESVILSYNNKEQVLHGEQYAVKDTSIVPEHELQSVEVLTIDVARGNTFSLILDDGTKVFLNSATKISFPRHFNSDIREVTLWFGEAYFEVAKRKNQPFIVYTQQSQVYVLGTSFNVNAYANENIITTTLIEGEVSFSSVNNQNYSLTPGMQSRMNIQTGDTDIENVNASVYTAWVDGKFIFQVMDLATIMRQIERWYAVDVNYQVGEMENYSFRGTISRDLSLQQVLDILRQTTDLTFTLNERTITIE